MEGDTHLLEMKVEATYGTKDDPVPSQNQGVPLLNSDIPNSSFFLASPNLGTRFLLRVVVCHIPKFGM
jgi:hypothetical protein